MTRIELTDSELHLTRSALHSFLTDFGHDEADVIREIQHLLDKLSAASGAPVGKS
ncbi:MAG: hypothetical protein ABI140_01685 [Jatrophihabitantaceae bacterium]